jgi:hypothetical protein
VIDDRELTRMSDALDELAKIEPSLAQFGGPEILLRLFTLGDRPHAWRYRTHGAAPLGQGAHLPPPQPGLGCIVLGTMSAIASIGFQ